MKIQELFLTALTALLVTTTSHAQESQDQQAGLEHFQRKTYKESELVLRYHMMQANETRDAIRFVSKMYGRDLHVETPGDKPKIVDNLFELDEMIVIYDTAEQVEKIVRALDQIDAELIAISDEQAQRREAKLELQRQKDKELGLDRGRDLVSLTYSPRFVGPGALGSALEPFTREFQVHEEDGTWHMSPNLRASDSPPVLLIRDTKANVAMIMDRIHEIDRPLPQVMLSAYLISPAGFFEGQAKAALPEELTRNLALLTPYKEFDKLAASSIRTNVSARGGTVLVLHRPDSKYTLDLHGLTYDEKTRSLTVGSALLRRAYTERVEHPSGHQTSSKVDVAMQTSFSTIEGEYAVIGISEEDGAPMLLAVTFRSIARPKAD